MRTIRITTKASIGQSYRVSISGANNTATIKHGSHSETISGTGVIRSTPFTFNGSRIEVKWYNTLADFDYCGGEYHDGSIWRFDWNDGPDSGDSRFLINHRSMPQAEPTYLEQLYKLRTNAQHHYVPEHS